MLALSWTLKPLNKMKNSCSTAITGSEHWLLNLSRLFDSNSRTVPRTDATLLYANFEVTKMQLTNGMAPETAIAVRIAYKVQISNFYVRLKNCEILILPKVVRFVRAKNKSKKNDQMKELWFWGELCGSHWQLMMNFAADLLSFLFWLFSPFFGSMVLSLSLFESPLSLAVHRPQYDHHFETYMNRQPNKRSRSIFKVTGRGTNEWFEQESEMPSLFINF